MKCWPDSRSFDRAALRLLLAGASLVLGACSTINPPQPSVVAMPPPVVVQPAEAPAANGAIYQERGRVRSLFEDRRPHGPGDILTIVFDEQVSASKNSQSNASRGSGSSFTPSLLPKGVRRLGDRFALEVEGDHEFQGRGGSSANNTFTGTMTVTVVQELANGNLRVHGEKQIAINKGTEYIRFSGTVDPRTIGADSRVASTRVADARIEYVGDGYVSEVQDMGWLQRVLVNVWPF